MLDQRHPSQGMNSSSVQQTITSDGDTTIHKVHRLPSGLLRWSPEASQAASGSKRQVTSFHVITPSKELRTGETTSSCKWDMLEGQELDLSCEYHFMSVRGSLWRGNPEGCCLHDLRGNGQLGAGRSQRLRTHESLCLQRAQYMAKSCHPNGVWCGLRRAISCTRSSWATYGNHGLSRDSRRLERRLLKSQQWRDLWGSLIVVLQFRWILEHSLYKTPLKIGQFVGQYEWA